MSSALEDWAKPIKEGAETRNGGPKDKNLWLRYSPLWEQCKKALSWHLLQMIKQWYMN